MDVVDEWAGIEGTQTGLAATGLVAIQMLAIPVHVRRRETTLLREPDPRRARSFRRVSTLRLALKAPSEKKLSDLRVSRYCWPIRVFHG